MNRLSVISTHGTTQYRNLTVGDVREGITTKLYKRMFKATPRKYIPVKDLTNDTMGRELSAYLINPEYIDKSVAPELTPEQLKPQPVVRVIQYSRLAYGKPVKPTARFAITTSVVASVKAAIKSGHRTLKSIGETVSRFTRKTFFSPIGHTYSLRDGMALHRRRWLIIGTSGITALAVFGALQLHHGETGTITTSPNPVPVSSTVQNPVTTSGIDPPQHIPVFEPPQQIVNDKRSAAVAAPSQPNAQVATMPTTTASQPAANFSQNPVAIEPTVPITPIEPVTAPPTINNVTEEDTSSSALENTLDDATQTIDGVTTLVENLL